MKIDYIANCTTCSKHPANFEMDLGSWCNNRSCDTACILQAEGYGCPYAPMREPELIQFLKIEV